MDKYFIKAILLEDCPWSISANKLLGDLSIPCTIHWITQTNKVQYKNEQIDTFPQIYFKKYGSHGNLLIGGYQDLSELVNDFFKQKFDNNKVNAWMSKLTWTKKTILRLIQVINRVN
jgi:hypothetical protein